MNKLTFSVLAIILLASCENVKVTNSKDEEAVPVKVISMPSTNDPKPDTPSTKPPTTKKYFIVTAANIDELVDKVQKEVDNNDGEFIGGPSMLVGGNCSQAMLVTDPKKNP